MRYVLLIFLAAGAISYGALIFLQSQFNAATLEFAEKTNARLDRLEARP